MFTLAAARSTGFIAEHTKINRGVSTRRRSRRRKADFRPERLEVHQLASQPLEISEFFRSLKVGHTGRANMGVPVGWIRRIVDARFAMQ